MVKRKFKGNEAKLTKEEDANKRRLLYVRQVQEAVQKPDSLVALTLSSFSTILDGLIADVVQDVHRAIQTDTLNWISVPEDLSAQAAVDAASEPSKPTPVQFPGRAEAENLTLEHVECQHCGRRLAASRYAPHLEKCLLGKGRSARGSKKVNYTE